MTSDTQAPAVGADLEEAKVALPASLTRKPIIDSVPKEMQELLVARARGGNQNVSFTRGELSTFLELAAAYQLDPFAGEVWLAKGTGDRVLIMVGRDGLRRIASRAGLRVYCDVIYDEDDFKVQAGSTGHAVSHDYSHPKGRTEIVGAWAQVFDTEGNERGFYVARMDEYQPTNERKLKYSPWGSQPTVMILAAAERQALRQATPLSGLVAQGELDRGEEIAEGLPSTEQQDEMMNALAVAYDSDLCTAILGVYDRAKALGHANLSDAGTWDLRLRGQDEATAREAVAEAQAEVDRFEAERNAEYEAEDRAPPEADVVGDDSADKARAQELRDKANVLLDRAAEAREAGDEDGEGHLEAEALDLRDEAERLDPSQPTLDGEGLG